MLPTFMVIGAQKAGTSSLWSYLDGHPEVFVTADKEPKFFVAEREFGRGTTWYESLFEGAEGAQARGECSTDYSVFPLYGGVPERIASVVPDIRLVYLMRDPIDRIRSAYAYALWSGVESRPIEEALVYDARYLYQSQYALQIEQYLAYFSLSKILLVKSEDLRTRRADTLRRIFSFIGVDPELMPANIRTELNTAEGRTKPRAWTRKVGDVLVRHEQALRRPMRRVGPYIERIAGHRIARQPIAPEELEMSAELVGRLTAYLRRDLAALRRLAGPGFDCWGRIGPDDVG